MTGGIVQRRPYDARGRRRLPASNDQHALWSRETSMDSTASGVRELSSSQRGPEALSVSNSSSLGGDWKLNKVAAIGDPPHPA